MNANLGAVLSFVVRLKSFYPLIRFLGALVIAWVISQFPLNYVEGLLFDVRMRLSPKPEIASVISTIAIDDKTMHVLSTEPTALDYALLLHQLQLDNPKAIVILDPPPFKKEFSYGGNIYFAKDLLTTAKPFSSAPLTRDNVSFAQDKVTRRLLLSSDGELPLQVKLAQEVNNINVNSYRGYFEDSDSAFTYIRYAPKGSFKSLSFIDIRDGRFPQKTFENKIVLIGINNGINADDYVLTPLSRDPLAMSRLEAQANVINTLINNNGINKSSPIFDFILTALVSYLTVLIVWGARPLKGIALLGAQALSLSVISLVLFFGFGLWINLTHPLLTILVSYYFFIPYRLIIENKRGWEFEQKNRLLTQVEELKTNFMSMMSHDLKTPIARIQGMAEIALSDDGNKLSAQQKQAIKTIMKSGEELNRFIGGILDLSRIESKEMKLNKTVKDVNAIIEDVAKKYEDQAVSKNIKLKTDLDPLFSIKIDVDLIRQVIANLIENAIKYSPENTNVTIQSREQNGKIVISVLDQGNGISKDEIDNVFLKFYRSKQAKASTTKGTGLGLYLAKYFIELHDGKIQVESEPQKGSCFNIELPM
ncbi:MAG: CHASE2 domain-containing protein [Oligoflexia bacterium]|nr:CHASE2 domain-containing protein [Oligoflexia bacterium]